LAAFSAHNYSNKSSFSKLFTNLFLLLPLGGANYGRLLSWVGGDGALEVLLFIFFDKVFQFKGYLPLIDGRSTLSLDDTFHSRFWPILGKLAF